jgi:thioredoxin-related protein
MKKTMALLLGTLLLSSTIPLAAQNYPSNYSNYAAGSYSSGQINWINNYADAARQAQMSGKPILILFTGTSWCPACMKLEREVLSKPQFAQAVGDKFIFVKAEISDYTGGMGSSYGPLLQRYGIEAFPSIVIVDANGQQISRVEYQAGGPEMYIRQLSQIAGRSQRQQGQPNQYYNPHYQY